MNCERTGWGCKACGLEWDTNEPCPPPCPRIKPYAFNRKELDALLLDRFACGVALAVLSIGFLVALNYLTLSPGNDVTAVSYAPPVEYAADERAVNILFTAPYRVRELCNSATAYGCWDEPNGRIIMPSPCSRFFTDAAQARAARVDVSEAEFYPQALCHEIGHVRGWMHGEGAVPVEKDLERRS